MQENNNKKKNFSNTMEINSILEENRKNRSGNSSQQLAKTQVIRKKVSNTQAPSFNDSFVVYDDEVKAPKKKKKGKKAGVIVALVLVLLVVLSAAGFCAYTFLGEFKYNSAISVNGISIGGMTQQEAKEALATAEKKLEDDIDVVINVNDSKKNITKDDVTYTFDTDKVLEDAKQYSKDNMFSREEKKYTISINVDEECSKQIADELAKEFNKKPVDAEVTGFDSSKKGSDMFEIKEDEKGVKVKTEEFEKQFADFFSKGMLSGTIDAEVEILEAEQTADFLKNNIKKLSSYKTVSNNTANGNTNMKISLEACNNSIINPGDVWSFNECTGNSNLESLGYKPADVLNGGRRETGIGGGICQSSSTIYNAALMCGMDVVERQPHSSPSAYVPIGLDATIDYGNIDLKLKNTFDYQLFLECYMEGTTLYCNFYGLENEKFDEIKLDSWRTSSDSSGYGAAASRTYYLDGKKVKTEDLPSSRYYYSGGGSSSSSSDSTSSKKKKPVKTEEEAQPEEEPTPTPEPEPAPEPEPEPEPAPEPEPEPSPEPAPAPEGEA